MKDNWKHRSKGMKCATCMWFKAKENARGIADIGRCRKHAPTMTGFPVVYVSDWCGDHRLNEETLQTEGE